MANKALNQVSQVQSTELANVKTFLAVMNNGEIKQMSKEDMSAVVGGLLSSNKLYPFMNRGKVTDFNTTTKAGMYLIGDVGRKYPGNPGIEYGTLEVFAPDDGSSTFVTQIAHNIYTPNKSYRRTFSRTTGEDVEWIEV